VHYGSFKTAEEANAIAKRIRLEINGEYDFSRRPQWDYDPSDIATVIDTDKAVKGRWYCPRVGRLFQCKERTQRGNGLEYGVTSDRDGYRIRIDGKAYSGYATAAEANAAAHKVFDELWGDNGKVVPKAADAVPVIVIEKPSTPWSWRR
jgi:hypothetical protein